MSQTVVERTAEHIAESAHHATRTTRAVADAIDDGVDAVKRVAKQSSDAAEEILKDTNECLHRKPVATIAATLAVGLTVGALLGWMLGRR
jgi:ElaB/YqjD/DUF883 family membrane-anchored ribosome-binding protein